MKLYKSFDEFWSDNGDDTPLYYDDVKDLCKKAFAYGECKSENTADGHSAEAAKDVRREGWQDAADIIETKSIPEGREIINSNIKQILETAGVNTLESKS